VGPPPPPKGWCVWHAWHSSCKKEAPHTIPQKHVSRAARELRASKRPPDTLCVSNNSLFSSLLCLSFFFLSLSDAVHAPAREPAHKRAREARARLWLFLHVPCNHNTTQVCSECKVRARRVRDSDVIAGRLWACVATLYEQDRLFAQPASCTS
jgi:hypothetical protein